MKELSDLKNFSRYICSEMMDFLGYHVRVQAHRGWKHTTVRVYDFNRDDLAAGRKFLTSKNFSLIKKIEPNPILPELWFYREGAQVPKNAKILEIHALDEEFNFQMRGHLGKLLGYYPRVPMTRGHNTYTIKGLREESCVDKCLKYLEEQDLVVKNFSYLKFFREIVFHKEPVVIDTPPKKLTIKSPGDSNTHKRVLLPADLGFNS